MPQQGRQTIRFPRILQVSLTLTALAVPCVVGTPLWAQLPATHLDAVFPPGTSLGKPVEVTIAGTSLDDVSQLLFSHPGITAAQKTQPPGPFDKGPQPVENTFVVTVAANVPPGQYDARAAGKYGISNPRAFVVADLPEALEAEPNNTEDVATEIQSPIVVNGRANAPADVDWYKFSAKRGERVLIDCQARRIDSRMDATLIVYDPSGRELDSNREGQSGDPLIDFTVAADGQYKVKVFDALYGGGNDYFYRLSIGVLPHVDFIFPPAGLAGSNAQYTIYGRNLPGGQPAGVSVDGTPLQKIAAAIALPAGAAAESLTLNSLIEPQQGGLDGIEYRLKAPQGLSNPMLVGIATAPSVVIEAEPNDAPDKAQKLAIPCEVMGQFYPMRDEDWFSFDAKQGDVYTIEVISQRLGLPTDPSFVIQRVTKNEQGEEQVQAIATVDDWGQRDGGPEFDNRTDDPLYRFVVPADGMYRVLVREAYGALTSDPRHVYRLAIRHEKPDFRLAAVPGDSGGALLLRKGGLDTIRVVAFRRDNFDGEIEVSVTGLPAGITCPSVIIGPANNTATLVLSAAENAAPVTGIIQVVGKAKIGNADVTRTARTGGAIFVPVMRQPNQQELSVPGRLTRSIAVSISADETAPVTFQAGGDKVWEASRAAIVKIPFTLTRRVGFNGKIDAFFADLPANIDAPTFAINPGTNSGEFQITLKNNTPVGTYTFNVTGFAQQHAYSRNPEAAKVAEERKKEMDKIATDTAAVAKTAADAKAAADKLATDTAAAAKVAMDAKAAADKTVADADAVAKTAADAAAKAKADAAASPNDAALAAAATAAQQAATEAATKAKTAADAVVTAQKALDDANTKSKVAADAKVVSDKQAEETAATAKAATDAKAIADKRATDTANAAKPININFWIASTPVTLKITPAPVTMTATSPSGMVKQGEKIEVAVAITRLYAFNDAVTLSAIVPNGVTGLQISNTTIAAGQNQGKLEIIAAANATPGNHTITVRSTMRLNNQDLSIDQPITLNVQAVTPPAN